MCGDMSGGLAGCGDRVTNGDEGREGTWTGLEEVLSEACRDYRAADGVGKGVLADERMVQKPDRHESLPRTHDDLPLRITSTCHQEHVSSSDNTCQSTKDNSTPAPSSPSLAPTP